MQLESWKSFVKNDFVMKLCIIISINNEQVVSIGIYLLKVNIRNTRTKCEICSKLIINTPERRHWRCFGVFIVNFEHISHLVLVFLLLILNM